jgi:membrane protein DedA with SNARE-associated domain
LVEQGEVFTFIGSAVWNTILIGGGYLLGSQWESVSEVIGPLSTPLLIAVVLAMASFLLWRGLRGSRKRATS